MKKNVSKTSKLSSLYNARHRINEGSKYCKKRESGKEEKEQDEATFCLLFFNKN